MTPKSIPVSTRLPPATAIRETKISLLKLLDLYAEKLDPVLTEEGRGQWLGGLQRSWHSEVRHGTAYDCSQ